MSTEEEKFDGLLLAMAEKHKNGVPEFLETIASFLRRKTDFFTGASKSHWENLLLSVFHKQCDLAIYTYAEQKDKRVGVGPGPSKDFKHIPNVENGKPLPDPKPATRRAVFLRRIPNCIGYLGSRLKKITKLK